MQIKLALPVLDASSALFHAANATDPVMHSPLRVFSQFQVNLEG
jgi:hypothetical protein